MPSPESPGLPDDIPEESSPSFAELGHPERRTSDRRSSDRRRQGRRSADRTGQARRPSGPDLEPSSRSLNDAATPGHFDPMEKDALTRPEYIAAMVHFYRGEMYRSQVWRTRLDTTTNWAVVTVAGMISFSFSQPDMPADLVLVANVLIAIFLGIEARRYRYFAVFRARVRMIEENFYLPMLRRDLHSPRDHWRESVASDLDRPKFKTTMVEAVMFRLRRNYVWLSCVVLVTWISKLFAHPFPAKSFEEVYARSALGVVPSWFVTGAVFLLYGVLFFLLTTRGGKAAAADEIHGLEGSMDSWKT